MAIRGDSFSSTSEVRAYTRHLLDGETNFNTTTIPTGTDVDKFIDRASSAMNNALSNQGFSPAVIRANSTAKLLCDDWVTDEAVQFIELTQRGQGYGSGEGSRVDGFDSLHKRALSFARDAALGWKRDGVAVADPTNQGLAFTALEIASDRTDKDDTTKEQPMFDRNKFDNPR